MRSQDTLADLLRQHAGDDPEIAEAVLREVLPELRKIAQSHLRRERDPAPFSADELINEVWIKKINAGGLQIENRAHFYAVASHAMRLVLVENARHRLAHRRGSSQESAASIADLESVPESTDLGSLIELGELMDLLQSRDPKAALVVDMHYFAGFNFDEIAQLTGSSNQQVRRRWAIGRDWLRGQLDPRGDTSRREQPSQPGHLVHFPPARSQPVKSITEMEVIEKAVEVIGDDADARRWLGTPTRALDYATPISLLHTPEGRQSVITVLGRLEHGVL